MNLDFIRSILDKVTVFISIIGIPLSVWKLIAIEKRKKLIYKGLEENQG